MTPAARVQAAIELLDEIIDAAREAGAAADTLIQRYFKTRRYAGSKDRQAVRDLVYRAVRRFGDRPASGRAAMIGLASEMPELMPLFDGSGHGPAPLVPGEPVAAGPVLPLWIEPHLDPLAERGHRLLERAPLDVRVNRLRGTADDALQLLPEAVLSALSPVGLRLQEGFRVEDHEAWHSGLVEVQDEGSQLVALACDVPQGGLVVDLCAGAGGKTLALAAEMANAGRILACDVDRGRLTRLVPRLGRAGVRNVDSRLLDPMRELAALEDIRGKADVVLVDAPCSGSGTWRRNPETRWRLTAARLQQLVDIQVHLLDVAAELVRPGGHLVYAVCSLTIDEGQSQAETFGARRSGFIADAPAMKGGRASGVGRLLTPAHDGTDGFFVARWRAPC